jgi:hypothetical protein
MEIVQGMFSCTLTENYVALYIYDFRLIRVKRVCSNSLHTLDISLLFVIDIEGTLAGGIESVVIKLQVRI